MTRLRCTHLSITASWWSNRKPINWGMPANDNFEHTSFPTVSWRKLQASDMRNDLYDDLFDCTPTGGKR